jgi:hypothetical protein
MIEYRRSPAMLPRLLALALAAMPGAAAAQADLDRIARCMRDNLPKTLRVGTVSLDVESRAGAGQQLFGSLGAASSGAGTRLVWSIRAPAALAGSAVLVRDGDDGGDAYLYLPSLGAVRRIQQSDSEGRMFGTDLSYGDAERVVSSFAGSALTVLGEDRYAGRPVWKIAATPPPERAGPYDRIDLSIDQQTCVALAAELLKNDVALKRWTVDPASLSRSGRYWYAADGTMRDLQGQSATRVHFSAVSTDAPLPATAFDPRSFYRGTAP